MLSMMAMAKPSANSDRTKGPLWELRERLGYSRADIASRLRVSEPAVAKWEYGTRGIDLGNAEELARIYRVTRSEILEMVRGDEGADNSGKAAARSRSKRSPIERRVADIEADLSLLRGLVDSSMDRQAAMISSLRGVHERLGMSTDLEGLLESLRDDVVKRLNPKRRRA